MVGLKDRGSRDLAGLRGPEDGDIFLSSLRPTTGFEKGHNVSPGALRKVRVTVSNSQLGDNSLGGGGRGLAPVG